MSLKQVSIFLLMLFGVTGCVSLATLVPPIDSQTVILMKAKKITSIPTPNGPLAVTEQMLKNGRQLYLRRCTSCHTVVPIRDHTIKQWQNILPDMFEEAKLDASKQRDVRAYVLVSRLLLPPKSAK